MATKEDKPAEFRPDLFAELRSITGREDLGLAGAGEEGDSPVVAQRRKEILEASLSIFSRKGYDASRTKEIAQAAGVSEATVFKYFPTKRHLLAAVMRPVIESVAKPIFLAPISRIIDRAAETGLEAAIVALLFDRQEVILKHQRLLRTLALEIGRQEDMLPVFGQLVMPLILAELGRLYRGVRERGEIDPDIDEILFSRQIFGTVFGSILILNFGPQQLRGDDNDREIRRSAAILMKGIGARR